MHVVCYTPFLFNITAIQRVRMFCLHFFWGMEEEKLLVDVDIVRESTRRQCPSSVIRHVSCHREGMSGEELINILFFRHRNVKTKSKQVYSEQGRVAMKIEYLQKTHSFVKQRFFRFREWTIGIDTYLQAKNLISKLQISKSLLQPWSGESVRPAAQTSFS